MTNFSSVSEDGEEGLCFVGQLSLGCLMSIFGGMLCESILKARPEIGLACGALAGIYLYHHFVHWTSFAQCAAICGVSSVLACIIFPEDIVVEALLTTFPAAAVAAGGRAKGILILFMKGSSSAEDDDHFSWIQEDKQRFPARTLDQMWDTENGDGQQDNLRVGSREGKILYKHLLGIPW